MPGTGDPGDAIAYDQDGSMLILHKFRGICSGGGRKPSYPAAHWLKLQKRLQKKKTDRPPETQPAFFLYLDDCNLSGKCPSRTDKSGIYQNGVEIFYNTPIFAAWRRKVEKQYIQSYD